MKDLIGPKVRIYGMDKLRELLCRLFEYANSTKSIAPSFIDISFELASEGYVFETAERTFPH